MSLFNFVFSPGCDKHAAFLDLLCLWLKGSWWSVPKLEKEIIKSGKLKHVQIMLRILHRFSKLWQLTADHKVGVQFKQNILTLCFPWKLLSNRSLAGSPWKAAPLALPTVAVTQPQRPYFPWCISPVSVDALCCEGQNSCSHVIKLM